MKVSDTSQQFENAPAGTHVARCVSLIGLGTRKETYQGNERWRSVIVVGWELPYEMREDGQPFFVSAWYTRSLSDKANLRRDLEAWRTRQFTKDELKDFEMKNLLDKGCQVIIAENEDGKIKVTGVAALPKGTTLPDRHNELKYFDVYECEERDFLLLTEKMQNIVKESREWQELTDHGRVLDDTERRELKEGTFGEPFASEKSLPELDDIPFSFIIGMVGLGISALVFVNTLI